MQLPELMDDLLAYRPPYDKIAKAMRAHSVVELGDINYRQNNSKFKDRNGETRAASMDISQNDRACRTLMVRYLPEEYLQKFHSMEVNRGYFLDHLIPMLFRKTFKDYRPHKLSEDKLKMIVDFNNSNRPKMRQVYGVTIPPYFPLDNEFDGMEYHHAWDLCVRQDELIIPEGKSLQAVGYFGGDND